MKKLFYLGMVGLAIFEIANVYFIMPMPGSQRMNSVQLAYFLHQWRWAFRVIFGLMVVAGTREAFDVSRPAQLVQPIVALVVVGAITGLFNFKMSADHMFRQPANPVYRGRAENKVDADSVVIGVEFGGEARAYPIRYILYHHQVRDTVGGKPLMVTYCNVCRTGRVFDPVVNSAPEHFRLVGMDHFNAMFEDSATGSWWRQATGEAVVGKLKGAQLSELPFTQLSLKTWFALHPKGQVLQADGTDPEHYEGTEGFERGQGKSQLTTTNSKSWEEKSWVLGVEEGAMSKAYDWNRLKKERVINDELAGKPIVLALAGDDLTFVVFQRPSADRFTAEGDTLVAAGQHYDFSGRKVGAATVVQLKTVRASQEFWHSWRTFHPATQRGE